MVLSACSDDSKGGEPQTRCPEGQSFNPIFGQCQPNVAGLDDTSPSDSAIIPDQDVVAVPDVPFEQPQDSGNQACEPNARQCVNDSVSEVCIHGIWERHVCPATYVCSRGHCEATGCLANAVRCVSNNQFQACGENGEFGEATTCADGKACVAGECVGGCSINIKERSNLGCDYISVRHDMYTPSSGELLAHSVVVSNPGTAAATLVITSPELPNLSFPNTRVEPLSSLVLDFPTTIPVITPGVSRRIFRIASDQPVIATQFGPLNNPGRLKESSDATLLLPVNALGPRYITLGWRGIQPGTAYVDIVAASPGTTNVTVTSPIKLNGGAAGSVAAGGTTVFTIHANQVLHLVDAQGSSAPILRDVSGIIVEGTQPIAVYTGARLVNIPDGPDVILAGDHIEQQMFPTDTWGTTYLGVPFESRAAADFTIFRVLAMEDETTVTFDPPVANNTSATVLARGQFFEFKSSEPVEVSADKPIQLGQYMIGGSINPSPGPGDGDPAFVLPAAIEQYRDDYVFLVPAGYRKNFVTIMAPAAEEVVLNGTPVAAASFRTFGSGAWKFATLPITAGIHTATSNQAFGVLLHGYDYYISYAFVGGIILAE
ncbi:MAG: IgGFc-binding protein [Bradymonadaceae bacterium]|nr:IgGFc-binding protein [Lujinxingiaceae bacterium]